MKNIEITKVVNGWRVRVIRSLAINAEYVFETDQGLIAAMPTLISEAVGGKANVAE